MTDDDKRWTRIWLTGGDNTTAWHPMIADVARTNLLFDPCIGNGWSNSMDDLNPPQQYESDVYAGIPIKFRILQSLAWIPLSWFLLTTVMNYNWYNVLGLIGSIALLTTAGVAGIYVSHRACEKDLSEMGLPREVKQHRREEKPEVVDAEADGRSSFVPNFCYKCGRTLEPAWTFCKECGTRVR